MIANKKILAVITARAGSVSVPGKNYRPLLGMPLYLWSVHAALLSRYVDKIVISSNCDNCHKVYSDFIKTAQELKDIRSQEVEWIQRPDEMATSTSKNEEALVHAVETVRGCGFDPSMVINLQPTSPCRTNNLLDRCIEAYQQGGHDSLLTGTKDTPFLWQCTDGTWQYTVDKNDCCDRKMRQEFKEEEFVYHDNGNIYITNTEILLATHCRIGYNPWVFATEGINNVQIDEEFDFRLIENLARAMGLSCLL